MYYDQIEFDIKCEWGIRGVEALFDVTDVFIIVDVLSFSSCVDIAVSNGAAVYPYNYKHGNDASEYAKKLGAELAISRKDNKDGKKYSLELSTLMNIPKGTKLVLPSPNGSAISFAAKDKSIMCGCLRNAKSVAEYVNKNYKRISIIPAGEKWEDGSMRFALEDMLSAGAIISYLKGTLSPESKVMLSVFESFRNNINAALKDCISGKELIERGFEKDVNIASELNISKSVPMMVDGGYVNAR
ncbi:MAG TPA: 2-phosphosulfolactate phosphatase [Ignavibacteria bacterium]|nr:2-phosphosulfolactate phosphatase [Ignavibacteria bacterium]